MKREYPKTLTVQDLIAELTKLPIDAKVYTEGCDCFGSVARVELQKDDGDVLLLRPEEN